MTRVAWFLALGESAHLCERHICHRANSRAAAAPPLSLLKRADHEFVSLVRPPRSCKTAVNLEMPLFGGSHVWHPHIFLKKIYLLATSVCKFWGFFTQKNSVRTDVIYGCPFPKSPMTLRFSRSPLFFAAFSDNCGGGGGVGRRLNTMECQSTKRGKWICHQRARARDAMARWIG